MAQDMTQATADNYGDYFATMKKKLQFISSTSASFKSTFESQLEAFSGALLGPLEDANDISDLTAKADLVLGNLQQVVGNYSQGLKTIGETVDVKLQNTNSRLGCKTIRMTKASGGALYGRVIFANSNVTVSSGAAKEGGGIAADGKIGAASADLMLIASSLRVQNTAAKEFVPKPSYGVKWDNTALHLH
eukprot:g9389.t1